MKNILNEMADIDGIDKNVAILFNDYVKDVLSNIDITKVNLKDMTKDIDSVSDLSNLLKVTNQITQRRYSPANTTYKSIEHLILGRDFSYSGGHRHREDYPSEISFKITSLVKLAYLMYIMWATNEDKGTVSTQNMILNSHMITRRTNVLKSHDFINNTAKKFDDMSYLIESDGDVYSEIEMKNKMKMAFDKERKIERPLEERIQVQAVRRNAIIITEEE